jgi:transposase
LVQLDATTPVFCSLQTETNTQLDFIQFLMDCIQAGYLQPGDFLLCDNARIHGGAATLELLVDLLEASHVTLIFLPTYSPELNPCELVFGQVKRYLREYRTKEVPLWFDITVGFSIVSVEDIVQYYKKCLQ